jgi:hypothetical protein
VVRRQAVPLPRDARHGRCRYGDQRYRRQLRRAAEAATSMSRVTQMSHASLGLLLRLPPFCLAAE